MHIHYSVISEEDDILYSTRSEEGGPGHAFAFTLEKGCRGPRGWEVALKGEQHLIKSCVPVFFLGPDVDVRSFTIV